MIKLYDFELSADCYKIRLMLKILRLAHETISVDVYPGREHMADWFLNISPLGDLPVLVDGDLTLCGAEAILIYLARAHDPAGQWLTVGEPEPLARIAAWLTFAHRLAATAGAARLADGMFHPADPETARAGAHRLFRVLDEHLWFAEQDHEDWLCPGIHPTIADIGCFPDVALSAEGGISHQDYPAIRRWLDRVRRIDGFVTMPGIFPASHGPVPRAAVASGRAPG